jgi:hypothetical protein
MQHRSSGSRHGPASLLAVARGAGRARLLIPAYAGVAALVIGFSGVAARDGGRHPGHDGGGEVTTRFDAVPAAHAGQHARSQAGDHGRGHLPSDADDDGGPPANPAPSIPGFETTSTGPGRVPGLLSIDGTGEPLPLPLPTPSPVLPA